MGRESEGLILYCNSKFTDSSHILLKPLINSPTPQFLWGNLLWKPIYSYLHSAYKTTWPDEPMVWRPCPETLFSNMSTGMAASLCPLETLPGRVCTWPSNLNSLKSLSICGLGAEGPQAHQRWLHGGLVGYMGPEACQLTPTGPENPVSTQDGKGKQFNALTSTDSSPSCFPS